MASKQDYLIENKGDPDWAALSHGRKFYIQGKTDMAGDLVEVLPGPNYIPADTWERAITKNPDLPRKVALGWLKNHGQKKLEDLDEASAREMLGKPIEVDIAKKWMTSDSRPAIQKLIAQKLQSAGIDGDSVRA